LPPFLIAKEDIDIVSLNISSLPAISIDVAAKETIDQSDLREDQYDLYFNNQMVDFSIKKLEKKPPSSIVILIDISYSIQQDNLYKIKSSAKRFIMNMSDNDRCAIYIFHDSMVQVIDFTNDKTELIKALNKIQRTGKRTLLFDSILKAIDILNRDKKNYKKNILIYSDGYDQYSKHTINNVIKKARLSQSHIFADGYTNISHDYLKSLKNLARKTQGSYTFNSAIDLYKKLDLYKKDQMFQFTFKGIGFQKNNYITLKRKSDNLTKKLHFTLDDYKTINSTIEKRFLYWILIVIGALLLLILVVLLIIKLNSKKSSSQHMISKKNPALKKLLHDFNEDIGEYDKEIIELEIYNEDDSDFDLFADVFLFGTGNLQMSHILSELKNLHSSDITKLIPFMIHVVKDSSGYDKINNLHFLKEMAQNLNLSLDSDNDINHLDEWWNKNKEKAIAEAKNNRRNSVLISSDFKLHENILCYFHDDEGLVTANISIENANKEELDGLSDKRIRLDTIISFYKENLTSYDNHATVDNYHFLQLYEISKESDHLYRIKAQWIKAANIDNDEVQRLLNLLLVKK